MNTPDQQNLEDFFIGVGNMDDGSYQDAIGDFTRALDRKQNLILSRYYRGQCYFQIGFYDEALTDFDKVIELDEAAGFKHGLTDVYFYRALVDLAKGDNVGAATKLASWFKIDRRRDNT